MIKYIVFQVDGHLHPLIARDTFMFGKGNIFPVERLVAAMHEGVYQPVAEVQARNLEDVFLITNMPGAEDQITYLAPMHSLSVGDVVFDGEKYHACASFGFEEVPVEPGFKTPF